MSRCSRSEQFTPEFLALNPLGKVPVLEDPRLGQPLAESGAILLWLAEREGKFLPTSQPARAEVMQWLMVQMANIGPMFGQVNHFRLVLQPGTDPYAEARYAAAAEKLYRLLDERLATREWLAGGGYSMADMATWPWANYLEGHGFDPAAHPHLLPGAPPSPNAPPSSAPSPVRTKASPKQPTAPARPPRRRPRQILRPHRECAGGRFLHRHEDVAARPRRTRTKQDSTPSPPVLSFSPVTPRNETGG